MTEILVIGGTGKSGSRVARQLAESGVTARVGARSPGASAPGLVPTPFEWYDSTTHKAAVDGASAVYVVAPGFTVDYVPVMEAFFDVVKDAGVPRVVLLSARGASVGDHIPMRGAEIALAATDLEHTILRPAWFNQNFSEYFLTAFVKDQNIVPVPTGSGKTPFVDLDDVAAVAVAALTGTGHAGKTYDLSGPESLSFADAAKILSDLLGREITFVDLAPGDWKGAAEGLGVPGDYADLVNELFALVHRGGEDVVSGDVARVLGREPRNFADWAASVKPVWVD